MMLAIFDLVAAKNRIHLYLELRLNTNEQYSAFDMNNPMNNQSLKIYFLNQNKIKSIIFLDHSIKLVCILIIYLDKDLILMVPHYTTLHSPS